MTHYYEYTCLYYSTCLTYKSVNGVFPHAQLLKQRTRVINKHRQMSSPDHVSLFYECPPTRVRGIFVGLSFDFSGHLGGCFAEDPKKCRVECKVAWISTEKAASRECKQSAFLNGHRTLLHTLCQQKQHEQKHYHLHMCLRSTQCILQPSAALVCLGSYWERDNAV